MNRFIAAGAAVLAALTLGTWATQAGAVPGAPKVPTAKAMLKDATGASVGTVSFYNTGPSTKVVARFLGSSVLKPGFHGFHIHANDLSAAGTGCKADPSAAPSTWFLSADGHYAKIGESHGNHAGDMPSLFVLSGGGARSTYVIDKIPAAQLKGRAAMVHAGPDNFGNVPVGSGDDQYRANKSPATDKTAKTGNSGDRVACGIIR